jgi:hypothetical protein
VSDLLPQVLRLQLGLSVRGDIAGGATYPDWLVAGIKFNTAVGRDPAHPAIRQHYPKFRLIAAASRERLRKNPLERFAIVGVHPLQNGIEF